MSKEILSVILGGGAGSRLYPLTASRSKPAVPIAGKYRLVDIPISNCINSNINRMFVLTQFNSASLNRHIKNTYHFSAFSSAFVDILAAEQTPDNPTWFQGTADAVRQSLRHIGPFESDYVLILSGDQLYQMDFEEMLQNHKDKKADISIATIPVAEREAPEFGILKSDDNGYITSFIEKPKKEILGEWVSDTGQSMANSGRIYLASMGIYIFNRNLLFDLLQDIYKDATDFGKEIIPESIEKYKTLRQKFANTVIDYENILKSLHEYSNDKRVSSLLINFKEKIIPIKIMDIALFTIEHKMTQIITFDKQKYFTNYTLDELEAVCGKNFYRANRQFLINRETVQEALQYFARKLVVKLKIEGKHEIIISKSKVSEFLSWLRS